MSSREEIKRQLNSKCFGCGQENPIGLRLRFHSEGNIVKAHFTPTEFYQGYPGYLHGGIICAILDEAMGWAAYNLSSGSLAITSKAQVKFKRPLPIDEPLIITAFITRKTKKLIWTGATISRKDGTVAAEGAALMVVGRGG
jgi:acyl-coenzyme A thioesterase PaaI-like protein